MENGTLLGLGLSLTEAKASATAGFTQNQKAALSVLAQGGTAEVRGIKGSGLGLKPGQTIKFDDVFIVRPSGVELLK